MSGVIEIADETVEGGDPPLSGSPQKKKIPTFPCLFSL